MDLLSKAWYSKAPWLWLLWPLGIVVQVLAGLRRNSLKKGQDAQLQCPVIVVGNITVGGTGKTPLLISLASHLQQQGLSEGQSRGNDISSPMHPWDR